MDEQQQQDHHFYKYMDRCDIIESALKREHSDDAILELVSDLFKDLSSQNTQTVLLWKLFVFYNRIPLLERCLLLYSSRMSNVRIQHDENENLDGQIKVR